VSQHNTVSITGTVSIMISYIQNLLATCPHSPFLQTVRLTRVIFNGVWVIHMSITSHQRGHRIHFYVILGTCHWNANRYNSNNKHYLYTSKNYLLNGSSTFGRKKANNTNTQLNSRHQHEALSPLFSESTLYQYQHRWTHPFEASG
jgi:hypothetical protein